MVHARGYNNRDDTLIYDFHEINMSLMSARNTDNIVAVYKQYGADTKMTPEQISYGFHYIACNKLEKTPEFWNYVIPLVKKQMLTLDSQTIAALKKAITGAGAMHL